MKSRNKDGMSTLLMVAIALVVVVIAAVVIISIARRARSVTNDTATQAFDAINEAANVIKNEYDGNTVQGSEVINAINKYASSTITVTVKTKANATGKAYTGAYTDPGVSDNDHVNEAAMFSSTVSTNTNGEVTGITFTQK